jgi:hypothetical protein
MGFGFRRLAGESATLTELEDYTKMAAPNDAMQPTAKSAAFIRQLEG